MLVYNTEKEKDLLFRKVFRTCKNINGKDTEYTIVTGYIGYDTPKELIGLGFKKVKVVIGMYGNRVSPQMHNILLKLQTNNDNINFYYTNRNIHTKMYVWHVEDNILEYGIGSANFSSSTALVENFHRETLDFFKPEEKDNNEINKYLDDVNKFLIPIEKYEHKKDSIIEKQENITLLGEKLSLLSNRKTNKKNIVGISTVKGGVGASSGLNWGFSNGLPLLSDAYIAISSEFIKNHPGIIPEKNKDENIPIEVVWDDGETMLMLLEGNQKINDKLYPKQISTYKSKSLLGKYLRTRIGNKINKDLMFNEEEVKLVRELKKSKNFKDESFKNKIKEKFITTEILKEYGRTSIKIEKLGDNNFGFDFKV